MYMLQAQITPKFMLHAQTHTHTQAHTRTHAPALSLFPCFRDLIQGSLFALHEAVEEVPFGGVRGAVVCLLTGFPLI